MKYTLILILVLSSFDAWSQNFTQNIKGTVSDKNLISPIEGVKLYLNGDSSNFVLSDSNGNYIKHFKNFGADAFWTHEARFAQKMFSGFQFGIRFL